MRSLVRRTSRGTAPRRRWSTEEEADDGVGVGLDGFGGATIAELQAHAGHASPEAAMRYQHATKDRATALAALIDKVIAADQDGPREAVVQLTVNDGFR